MKYNNLKLFIGGEFVDAEQGETFQSLNPANGEPIAQAAWAGPKDASRAVEAASKALEEGPWAEMSAQERRDLMLKLAGLLKARLEDFAVMECLDAGALISKARADVSLGVSQLKYFAEQALRYDRKPQPVEGMQKPGRSFTHTVREPIGVCAQIIPWNFPLTMAIWKLGPALATGNTLVLKCAPETPVSALQIARLCDEAGFPPGVINIITGDADVGEALLKHPKVRKVSFTGSTEVGRQIMAGAAADMKRLTLECGGKSANIVLDDADPAIAVDGSLYATFFHSGQVCESGTRLFLSNAKHDDFVGRMVERVEKMKIGDPMDPETTIGPVVSEKQLARVMGYIDLGVKAGAKVAVGGKSPKSEALRNGFFVEPTIFTDVTNDMRIAREEIFGPVLSVLRYGSVDEAVRMANDSEYGLAAGVWGADESAEKVAAQLQAGWVWINEWHMLSVSAPFGGYKQSGIGREFGEIGLDAYTEIKTIYKDDTRSRAKKFWYDVVVPAAE